MRVGVPVSVIALGAGLAVGVALVLAGPSTRLIEEAAPPTTIGAAAFTPSPEHVDVIFPGYDDPSPQVPASPTPPEHGAASPPPAIEPLPSPVEERAPSVLGSVDVADQALERVQFDWRSELPGWRIEFPGPRKGLQGATFPAKQLIQIYVRGDQGVDDVAHVIGHELGHAYDVTYFDQAQRSAFQVLRGRPGDAGWFVADGQSDFASGAGDWAESFAWVVTGGAGEWRSRLGSPPDIGQTAVIREMLR